VSAPAASAGLTGSADVFTDERGTLTVVASEQIPFVPARTYVLHDLPAGALRGRHANRTQRRMLVGLAGESTVTLVDGDQAPRVVGLSGGQTLVIEPGVWHQIAIHDEQTSILVFADGSYDPDDVIAEPGVPAAARGTAAHTESASASVSQ
jgi:dTDP-4-dehydrorhamnose 3,5-epimerase-like enzyme